MAGASDSAAATQPACTQPACAAPAPSPGIKRTRSSAFAPFSDGRSPRRLCTAGDRCGGSAFADASLSSFAPVSPHGSLSAASAMTALLRTHSSDCACSDTCEPLAADPAAALRAAQQEQLMRVASEVLPALHKAQPAAAALLRAQLLAAVLQTPVVGLPAGPAAGPSTCGGTNGRQPSGGAGDAALGNQASSGCRLTAALLAMGVRHIEASLPPFDVAELRLARTFLATFP